MTHFRRILAPIATAALLVAGSALTPNTVRAQTIDFESLGYTGNCDWRGSTTQIGNYDDFFFGGLFALDINNYQSCWQDASGPRLQLNGYIDQASTVAPGTPLAPVVALGTFNAFIQQETGLRFDLDAMSVGAGWTNTRLTFTGYQGMTADNPAPTFTRSVMLRPGTITDLDFGWAGLNYLTVGVEFGIDDQYGSSALNAIATGNPNIGPYQTYFVSSMTVSSVPEPSTVLLLSVGLLGLGLVAVRRRGQQGV